MADKTEHDLQHIWHCWMNQYADERREAGESHPHSLYGFRDMLDFLRYGHKRLQQAFEDKLPTLHRQCSLSQPEPIQNNQLRCALGKNVRECPILQSLAAKFAEESERTYHDGKPRYEGLGKEHLYQLMARTCAWHIYAKSTGIKEGFFGIDSSEGYLMDGSDRMFWTRVYQSMAAPDGEEPEAAE